MPKGRGSASSSRKRRNVCGRPLPLGVRPGGQYLPRGILFTSGASNPAIVAAEARKAHKAARAAGLAAERVQVRKLIKRARVPVGQPRRSLKEALTEAELRVIKACAELPTPPSVAALAAELGRGVSTVYRILQRLAQERAGAEAEQARRQALLAEVARTDAECFICMDRPHCAVLAPCAHGGLCATCAAAVLAAPAPTCPLCRAPAASFTCSV